MRTQCHVAVVGAGAAGLMAAISAARSNSVLKINLFDSREKIGAKILMSGGTRCNVTHREVLPQDYQGGSRNFIKNVLHAFDAERAKQFFKEIGVELVLEETGKLFPATHSGKTVLEALVRESKSRHVELISGVKITQVRKEKDFFILKGRNKAGEYQEWAAQRVVLTTGGLSYPETGSDGAGYEIAEAFGHTLAPRYASLTPLTTEEAVWKMLSGVALEVRLSFYLRGKKIESFQDSFLFTHFGFSGPAAMNVSRFVEAHLAEKNWHVEACFLPHTRREDFEKHLVGQRKSGPLRKLKNLLAEDYLLPQSFVERALQKNKIKETLILNQLKGAEQDVLTDFLYRYKLPVSGTLGYKKAEVTAGGVRLEEVQYASMESRKEPGLHFAGEILDADGRIGGFNFQWAWSTGYIAGTHSAKSFA